MMNVKLLLLGTIAISSIIDMIIGIIIPIDGIKNRKN